MQHTTTTLTRLLTVSRDCVTVSVYPIGKKHFINNPLSENAQIIHHKKAYVTWNKHL